MFQEELTLGSFLFRLHDDVQFSKISYKNVIYCVFLQEQVAAETFDFPAAFSLFKVTCSFLFLFY